MRGRTLRPHPEEHREAMHLEGWLRFRLLVGSSYLNPKELRLSEATRITPHFHQSAALRQLVGFDVVDIVRRPNRKRGA
jgi:hypothetical protein